MSEKRADIAAALQQAATIYRAFIAASTEGASEQALHNAVTRTAGQYSVSFDLLSGPRTAGIEGGATERKLQRGDVLILDLCLHYGQHWCDVCRTYFLGEPQPAIRKVYQTVLECFDYVANLLRDNVSAKTVYAAATAFLGKSGLSGWMRHHTGHGIGRTPFESPIEVATSLDVIRAGDVVTVEIGVYCDGEYGIRVEDDFFITLDGAQNLWNQPKKLADVILPWPGK